MNIEKLVPLVGFVVIFLIIAWPAAKAIVINVREGRRLRRIRKVTPGPLLGVVYPQDKKD
jgi:hypothetical protein